MLLVYYWNPIKKRRREEEEAPLEKNLPENATVPYSNADDAEVSTGGYNVTLVYTDGTEDPPPHSGMRSIERDPYLMTIDANTAAPPNPINPQEHQNSMAFPLNVHREHQPTTQPQVLLVAGTFVDTTSSC